MFGITQCKYYNRNLWYSFLCDDGNANADAHCEQALKASANTIVLWSLSGIDPIQGMEIVVLLFNQEMHTCRMFLPEMFISTVSTVNKPHF